VFCKLPTAKRLRGEIHNRLMNSNAVLANAQENVEKARRAYNEATEELAEISSQSKWSKVATSFRSGLADSDEAQEAIDSAGKALGFEGLFDKPEALVGILDQAKTLGGRAGILTSSIKVKRYIGNIALILLGMLLLSLGVFLAYQFQFDTNDIKKVLDGLGKFLTLTSTATAVTAAWLAAWGHNKATRAISELDRYDTILRLAIRSVDIEHNTSLDICKATVSQFSEELTDAIKALALAQADVARVSSELRQFDDRGSVGARRGPRRRPARRDRRRLRSGGARQAGPGPGLQRGTAGLLQPDPTTRADPSTIDPLGIGPAQHEPVPPLALRSPTVVRR